MEKTYISPDIIVVEMENNLMDVISKDKWENAAGDSGKKPDVPVIGKDPAPESSKDNGFDPWSTWGD